MWFLVKSKTKGGGGTTLIPTFQIKRMKLKEVQRFAQGKTMK